MGSLKTKTLSEQGSKDDKRLEDKNSISSHDLSSSGKSRKKFEPIQELEAEGSSESGRGTKSKNYQQSKIGLCQLKRSGKRR